MKGIEIYCINFFEGGKILWDVLDKEIKLLSWSFFFKLKIKSRMILDVFERGQEGARGF